jgi:hypothetical protein
MVVVDVVGADVRCASNQIDLDVDRWAGARVVGLDAVVPVGDAALLAVQPDEVDVAGFPLGFRSGQERDRGALIWPSPWRVGGVIPPRPCRRSPRSNGRDPGGLVHHGIRRKLRFRRSKCKVRIP